MKEKLMREFKLWTESGKPVNGPGGNQQWSENPSDPMDERRRVRAESTTGEKCEWKFSRVIKYVNA